VQMIIWAFLAVQVPSTMPLAGYLKTSCLLMQAAGITTIGQGYLFLNHDQDSGCAAGHQLQLWFFRFLRPGL